MSIDFRKNWWYKSRAVVRPCTASLEPPMEMRKGIGGMAASKEGAARLKARLQVAMAEAHVGSWLNLAIRSGVADGTIENVIYGITEPRYATLAKLAKALSPYVTVGELEREYEGLAPDEPPLILSLQQLVPELQELVVLLRAQADQEVLEAVRDVLARRRRGLPPRGGEDQREPSGE